MASEQQGADLFGGMSTMIKAWSDAYRGLLAGNLTPPFVAPLKTWFGSAEGPATPLPLGEYAQTAAELGRQWFGFVSRIGARTGDALRGELRPDAARELYDSWLRGYEETLGRLFHVPTIGPLRQVLDKHLHGMDAFVKYQAALTDFTGKLAQPGLEALGELAEQTRSLARGPITAETLSGFYQLLLRAVERRFALLLKSPPFLAALEHTLLSSLEFHARLNSLLEEQLRGTPIVTRRELDEALRDLHELKQEVRGLRQE